MVYLGGDNNLPEAGEMDLAAMATVGSTEDLNIVAEFDRIGDKARTKRYCVGKGKLTEVADLGETDCGDAGMLLDFVVWAAQHYPAERYALVLWNHGGGWPEHDLSAICMELGLPYEPTRPLHPPALFRSTLRQTLYVGDWRSLYINGDDTLILDAIELSRVLQQAVNALGRPLDLLGMDGSLLSTLEVAYQARRYVKYLIASEASEPVDGWPYTDVLQKLADKPDISTVGLAAHIVDVYDRSRDRSADVVTLAALDLSKVEDLADATDALASALLVHMPEARFEIWNASQRPAASFWYNTLWDISHFCQRLEQSTADGDVEKAAKEVGKALKRGSFVVAESHRGEKVELCGGVTVYLKGPPDELSRYYSELDFAQDYQWFDMLKAYHDSA